MMCFVVIYKGGYLIQQGMQIDDGTSVYAYAKEKGYSVRKWDMYGINHFHELNRETRKEIKDFIDSLN